MFNFLMIFLVSSAYSVESINPVTDTNESNPVTHQPDLLSSANTSTRTRDQEFSTAGYQSLLLGDKLYDTIGQGPYETMRKPITTNTTSTTSTTNTSSTAAGVSDVQGDFFENLPDVTYDTIF